MAFKNLTKGLLIAFEGIDGAGKTTQALLLKDFLVSEGYEATYLKEPTNGMFGQRIRFLATNGRHHVDPEFEFNLFLEDRKEDVQKNISPALKSRKVVIMDRYYFSNICYQGALGLDVKIIQRKNEEFAPKPDLVILLDVSPRVGISRITKIRGDKTNHFEKERYLSKVKKLFDKLDDPYVQRISSVAPIDDVQMEVQNASLAILRRYAVEEQKNTQRNLQRIRRSAR